MQIYQSHVVAVFGFACVFCCFMFCFCAVCIIIICMFLHVCVVCVFLCDSHRFFLPRLSVSLSPSFHNKKNILLHGRDKARAAVVYWTVYWKGFRGRQIMTIEPSFSTTIKPSTRCFSNKEQPMNKNKRKENDKTKRLKKEEKQERRKQERRKRRRTAPRRSFLLLVAYFGKFMILKFFVLLFFGVVFLN